MTARFILIGRGDAISRQLSAMQPLGLVPSGPKIITREGGSTSRQHDSTSALKGGQFLRLAADHGRLV